MTKKKVRPEHQSEYFLALLLFDCLDKVGKPTERNRPEARGQVTGTAWQNLERYGMGLGT